jgi:hypothetical protein
VAPVDPQRAGPWRRCPVRQGNVVYRTGRESRAVAAAASCRQSRTRSTDAAAAAARPSKRLFGLHLPSRGTDHPHWPQAFAPSGSARPREACAYRDARPIPSRETTIIKHHPDLVPEITTYDPEHPRNDVNTAVEIAPEHGMTQRRQDGPQPGIVRRRPGLTAVQNLPVCLQAGLMLKQRRQCGAFDRSLRALP